jgi:hypothetical protein
MVLARNPCLLIAVLILSGCSLSQKLSERPIPLLDASLAQPCPPLSNPGEASYDAWQDWIQSEVLKSYGECAARHAATVKAWPSSKPKAQLKEWWKVW